MTTRKTTRLQRAPRTRGARPDWRAGQGSLQVRALGKAEVLVDGHPAKWHARPAETLFYYLLAHREGRAKDQILEDIWGVEVDDATDDRFRVNVHRVRAALGWRVAIVRDRERYCLGPTIVASSDIEAFRAAVQTAEQVTDPEQRRTALERALDAYGGDFLPLERSDWAVEERERLRGDFVRVALKVAEEHCAGDACDKTVAALRRALHSDPYLGEDHYQRLMACLARLGEKHAAIEVFRRFVRFLRDEIDDTPAPETRALAERIKLGESICLRRAPLTPAPYCPLAGEAPCPYRQSAAAPTSGLGGG